MTTEKMTDDEIEALLDTVDWPRLHAHWPRSTTNRSPLYDYTNHHGTMLGNLTVVGLHRSHAHILVLAEWIRLMCERLPLSDRAKEEVGKLLKPEDAEALLAQAKANVRRGRIVPR